MMSRTIALVVGLLVTASLVSAQTNRRVEWDVTGPTLLEVRDYSVTMKIGSGPETAIVPTCVAGPPVHCQTPLATLPPSGTVIVITNYSAGGSASGSTTVPGPPAAPTGLKIVVVVTVP